MRCGPKVVIMVLLLATPPATAQDLVPYRITNGAIEAPLTSEPGNPGRGRRIVADMERAPCLICHALPIPEEPDHGAVGPSLEGVGARLTPGQIRLRIVDPKAVDAASIMPSYYRADGFHRVQEQWRGKPIYTAQEIEDVVAYLSQLKDK